MIAVRDIAFTTVAIGKDVALQSRFLKNSAEVMGIDLLVCDEGSELKYNHAIHKVECYRRWLKKLPPAVSHIVFVDAFDSFFAQPADWFAARLAETDQALIVGAERENWPERNPHWANCFPKTPSGRNFINTGFFMGQREALDEALALLDLARTKLENDFPAENIDDVYWLRNLALGSEQLLWQIARYKRWFEMSLDDTCQYVANVTTDDHSVKGNAFYRVDRNQIVVRESGLQPGVVHFPGPGIDSMPAWFEIFFGNAP